MWQPAVELGVAAGRLAVLPAAVARLVAAAVARLAVAAAACLACRLLLINRVSSLQGGRWHLSVLPTLRSCYPTGQARRKEKGRPY